MEPETTNNAQVTEQKTVDATIPENKQELQGEETPQQINWRKFRQQREVERKQKEESDRRAAEKEAEAQALKAALEALTNKPAPAQTQYSQYNQDEQTTDQIIEKKLNDLLAQRARVDEEQRRQREAVEMPSKLRQMFPDFDKVVNTENLDYLDYHYPEVSKPLSMLPNGMDRWVSIYNAAKKFIPNTESKKEHARVEKNLNKPQSMSVPGATQTGDSAPQFIDEKRRQENWSRMQKVMKGAK